MWVRNGKTIINNPQSHHCYGWDWNHQQWGGLFLIVLTTAWENRNSINIHDIWETMHGNVLFSALLVVLHQIWIQTEISFELSLLHRQAWETYSSRGWYLYTKKCDLKWAVRMGEHQMDWNRNGFHPCLGNEPNKSISGTWIGPRATVFILPPTIGILAI